MTLSYYLSRWMRQWLCFRPPGQGGRPEDCDKFIWCPKCLNPRYNSFFRAALTRRAQCCQEIKALYDKLSTYLLNTPVILCILIIFKPCYTVILHIQTGLRFTNVWRRKSISLTIRLFHIHRSGDPWETSFTDGQKNLTAKKLKIHKTE